MNSNGGMTLKPDSAAANPSSGKDFSLGHRSYLLYRLKSVPLNLKPCYIFSLTT